LREEVGFEGFGGGGVGIQGGVVVGGAAFGVGGGSGRSVVRGVVGFAQDLVDEGCAGCC